MGDQVIIIQGYQRTEKIDLASMLNMGQRKKTNCATRMCCLRLKVLAHCNGGDKIVSGVLTYFKSIDGHNRDNSIIE